MLVVCFLALEMWGCWVLHKEGFAFRFDELACDSCTGRCCTGDSGYIWITEEELQRLAEHLRLSFDQCLAQYAYKEGERYSLRERWRSKQQDWACVFFQQGCQIYEYRPVQCRTYPFWDVFKEDARHLLRECPGIEVEK